MSQTQDNVYAKVEGGVVVEFPVSVDTILARGHSVFQYHRVQFNNKPYFSPETSTLTQQFQVTGNRVIVAYITQDFSLQELLTSFKKSDGKAKFISDISPNAITVAKSLISNYIEGKISNLARQRGYVSLNNILGRYSNSNNPNYKAEAAYIQKCLDDSWANLEQYFTNIITNQAPVPTSMEEIDAVVGTFSWDNMPAK
jgi:hypothetical protein